VGITVVSRELLGRKSLSQRHDDDDDDGNNNNNNNNITSFEETLALLVCKTIDLNLSQLNQHTSAPLL